MRPLAAQLVSLKRCDTRVADGDVHLQLGQISDEGGSSMVEIIRRGMSANGMRISSVIRQDLFDRVNRNCAAVGIEQVLNVLLALGR